MRSCAVEYLLPIQRLFAFRLFAKEPDMDA